MFRIALVALAVLLVAPSLGAPVAAEVGSPVTTRAHPPMRFVNDAQFAATPGITGSGTAADPYVIADWIILVPERPVGFASSDWEPAGLSFEGTRAHVVVRDTTIFADPRWNGAEGLPGGPAATSGIRIVGASNVAIVNNEFTRLGGLHDVIDVRSGTNLRIEGNTFLDTGAKAIRFHNAAGSIVENTIRSDRWMWSAIEVSYPSGPVEISRNVVTASSLSMGAIAIEGSPFDEARHEMLVTGNVVDSLRGITLRAHNLTGVITDNEVRATEMCFSLTGAAWTVEGNTFHACGWGAWTDAHAVPTILDNTYGGKRVVQIRGASGLDIDATDIGWLQVVDSRDVTIRDYEREGRSHNWLLRSRGITIEDSRITGQFTTHDVRDLTLRNVIMPHAHLDVSGTVVLDRFVADGGWPHLHLMGDSAVHVVDSLFTNSWQQALSLVFDSGCSTVHVERSEFSHSEFSGLRVYGGVPDCNELKVRHSTFTHNWAAGIDLEGPGFVDARENWWGHADGPLLGHGHAGRDAIQAEEGGIILVAPWLTSAP